jgi:hypothetical protein
MNAQKAETAEIFRQMAQMEEMPGEAAVHFQFVPEDGSADWDAFTEAAEGLGYAVEWYEASDPDEERYAEITTAVIALTPETVWMYEEKLTLLAAIHGFAPDGWSFFTA